MRILIDTHIVLWWLADDDRLPKSARELISDEANTVLVSAATVWEVAIKEALGKLEVMGDFEEAVYRSGFTELPITFLHAAETKRLPHHHRDPFDRLLIAQCRVENLPLLTADRQLQQYPANVVVC